MRTLIVEDEVMAGNMLARTLTENFRDIEVVGITESVRASVDWLNAHAADPPDIIFMDVELSDGDCFEIFRQVEVRSQIIMTTAYDTYAVKAFETGSIDYLLKPIGLDALTRAVNRCREPGKWSRYLRLSETGFLQNPATRTAGWCVWATR